MEAKVARRRGRPRKRKLEDEIDLGDLTKTGSSAKRQVLEIRSSQPIAFVGRYVLKGFEGRVLLGKIVSYSVGLYNVVYEDGNSEDAESGELRELIQGENSFNNDLITRRNKLDEVILKKKSVKKEEVAEKQLVEKQTSVLSELRNGSKAEEEEEDDDSFSDSHELVSHADMLLEADAPLTPAPQLPPSSGTIGVPEESVPNLFSVYGFLRSFSIQLFLSPFGLDDFVGALKCSVPNTLLDAIHVSLMRLLKRHLEKLSLDGSELASKCLRCVNWSLLDTLTWPVFLVQYLITMGYGGSYWKGFYEDVVDKEYYVLPIGMKLKILQILCDVVLDSAEIRFEVSIRGEAEVGMDPDAITANLSEDGPRSINMRSTKTSACKEREAVVAESHEWRSSDASKIQNGAESVYDAAEATPDGNADECRLCGMDGTLLCCDGCPFVYHSRCIGVAKMHIPKGPWYCPECMTDKMGLTIAVGTSRRGAELFGTDLYEQIFLGTCNHLLVIRTSINTEACIRYYNVNHIPKVVQLLLSSAHHRALYWGICKAILQYWDLPETILPPVTAVEMITNAVQTKKYADDTPALPPFSVESYKAPVGVEAENVSHLQKSADICQNTSMGVSAQINLPGTNKEIQNTASLSLKPSEHAFVGPVECTSSVGKHVDYSSFPNQSLSDRSSMVEIITSSTSGNSTDSFGGDSTVMYLTAAQSKASENIGFRSCRNLDSDFIYMGSCFKPQAYINHYLNGDFAASAAANVAVLLSEESNVSISQKYKNARKAATSNISFQFKAFSLSASRFFWPSYGKKEVTRERCGWCHFCKLTSPSRKGCMINAAITGATKNAAIFFSKLLPLKSGEGNLSSIAAYILYLEESLHGLISGPFLSESHRKHWRKKVEGALTARAIKFLLLELGENICSIALSEEWIKPMGDGLMHSAIVQSASCTMGTSLKPGPGGKGRRKQSDVTVDGLNADSFGWWQGGKLSKLILQKTILPKSIITKAACQGGIRNISGIKYNDGLESTIRSKSLIWRAAVESSKNVAQLALQVKQLDSCIKWNELLRPDQDVKCTETEAAVFRNTNICDKKIIHYKVLYGVAFENQKHLPSCVTKNVIEIEQTQDGKEKYWFPEKRIPLYLIKEYEENLQILPPPLVEKPSSELSDLQRRQLKASRQDIFSYLACKRDKLEKCVCASCPNDVILRNAATCNACQGFCHKSCTLSLECSSGFLTECESCYLAKAHHQNHKSQTYPITSPPSSMLEHHNVTPVGGTQLENLAISSVTSQENSSLLTQSTSKSRPQAKSRSKLCSWGVIRKKKRDEDTGVEFRLANILLNGNFDEDHPKPVCVLCQQPYNSDLIYIRCENCKEWYHGDAVKLDKSKVVDVVTFKCSKCRATRSPECPYMDPNLKVDKHKKKSTGPQKHRAAPSESGMKKPPSNAEPAASHKIDCLVESTEKQQPLSIPGCDTSIQGVESELFNYGNLNYDEMEYEPQTYFSLTELLASDDEGGNTTDNMDNQFGPSSQFGDQMESQLFENSDATLINCQICSHMEPTPNLCCQNCGYSIHSQCSPWKESACPEGSWRCGHCRST